MIEISQQKMTKMFQRKKKNRIPGSCCRKPFLQQLSYRDCPLRIASWVFTNDSSVRTETLVLWKFLTQF